MAAPPQLLAASNPYGMARDIAKQHSDTRTAESNRKFVAEHSESAHRVSMENAYATYTYVSHGNRYFAVGAARCAFFYPPPVVGDARFVLLPHCIAKRAVAVLTAPQISSRDHSTDFVAVELDGNPLGDDAPLPPWPVYNAGKHLGQSVYGWSNTGDVGGNALAEDGEGKSLIFNDTICKGGHACQSGTLMFSAATDSPIGVFLRGGRAASLQVFRQRIVRLPPIKALVHHKVLSGGGLADQKGSAVYCTKKGAYQLQKEGGGRVVRLRSRGKVYAGVLIANVPAVASFTGATVPGASRPFPCKESDDQ